MEQWLTATLEVADPGVGEGMALLAGDSTTRIDYTYDPLGRLTAADYTPQTFFHYTYDAAGNRTSLNACLGPGCIAVITTYAYDYAQRLSSVNAAAYTWDNNGNLLSNGVTIYTYNHANRLTATSGPGGSYTYGYNGLGDRLQQVTGGVTTRYPLDLNNDPA
jgi:YD repeat-containing protein